MKALFSLLVAVCFSVALSAAEGDVEFIIGQARQFLGGEAALSAVQSIRLSGRLEVIEDVNGEARREGSTIELTYQKPAQHRMVLTLRDRTESTGVDGFSGWLAVDNPKEPRAQVSALGLQSIRSLRLSVGENLNFFRNPAAESVKLAEVVDVEGRKANKVVFTYDRGVVFTRYFAQDSGELIQSETPQGALVAEVGRIEASGVKFPQRTISLLTLPDGKVRRVEMVLENIQVNQVYPDSDFAMPVPVRRP
jgi:hypothetical protein